MCLKKWTNSSFTSHMHIFNQHSELHISIFQAVVRNDGTSHSLNLINSTFRLLLHDEDEDEEDEGDLSEAEADNESEDPGLLTYLNFCKLSKEK